MKCKCGNDMEGGMGSLGITYSCRKCGRRMIDDDGYKWWAEEPRNLAKPNAQPALSDGWRKFPEEDPATYWQPHGLFLVYAHHTDLNCNCFEIMSYFPDWIGEKWMRHRSGGGPIDSNRTRVLAFRELVPPAFA